VLSFDLVRGLVSVTASFVSHSQSLWQRPRRSSKIR
jgi:hypothetical protein